MRSLAVLLFEMADDIPSILGKPFREALNGLGVLPRFEPELALARKLLNAFREENGAFLNRVRNLTGAHRDHDGLVFFYEIEALRWMQMVELGLEFSRIVNQVAAVMQRVVTKTSNITGAPLAVG